MTTCIPDLLHDDVDPIVVQIDTPKAKGRTSLCQASFGDDLDMIHALISSGANPRPRAPLTVN